MKKIFKRSKHVVLLLLITLLSFGFIAVSSNNNSLSVNAETNSPQFEKSYFSLDYSNNELTLLFSPNFNDYKEIQKSDLVEFKNLIVSKISDIFAEETKDVKNSRKNSSKKLYSGLLNVDISAIEGIAKNQLSNMEEIEVNFLDRGSYDTLIKFYVDRYSDEYVENNPSADVNDVLDSIATNLIEAVNEKVTEVYQNAGEEDFAPTNDITSKIIELVDEVRSLKENGQSVKIGLNDVKDVMNIVSSSDDIVAVIKTIDVDQEINQIINEASGEEIVDFFTEVDIDKIIDVTKNTTIIGKDDFNNVANKVGVTDLVKIADAIGQDKIKEFADVINVTASDISQIIKDNISNIGIKDILTMVTAIRINNEAVYSNKEFSLIAVKNIVAQLPRPSEIAQFTDEQMRLSWDIEIDTVFGSKGFKLTVGFDGDCSKIRRLAELVDRYVEVSVVDGTYHLNMFTPSKLSDLLLSATQTSRISDSLKNKIFNALSLNVNDVYELVQEISFKDIVNVLKSINYKKIVAKLIDADVLNSYLHTTVFTNERIDQVIDYVLDKARLAQKVTYEDIQYAIEKYTGKSFDNETLKFYANKVLGLLDLVNLENIDSQLIREFAAPNSQYSNDVLTDHFDGLLLFEDEFDRVKSLISKVYNHIPEKYKSVSLFDVYQGSGEFDLSKTFNVKELLSKVEYKGYKLSDILSVLVDYIPDTLSFDFNVKTTDIYQISFVYDGKVKKGFLPVGTSINLFGQNLSENGNVINEWFDKDGNKVETMPAHDVVLYSNADVDTDFNVITCDNVNKVYDGKAVELYVIVEGDGSYSYQWYKNNELIEGAISDKYSVMNVEDSGEYYCVVTSNSGSNKKSNIIVVSIEAQVITIPELTWSVAKTNVYTGTEFKAHITNLPNGVKAEYENDKATNVGKYTTKVKLSSLDSNYVVSVNTAEYGWEITPKEITIPSELTWSVAKTNVYTGTEFEAHITNLPNGVKAEYENYKATNVGKYTTKATLSAIDSNYVVETETCEYTWKITPQQVDLTNVKWDYENAFIYDGNKHEVTLVGLPEIVKVTYKNNEAKEAGSYLAQATLVVDDNHCFEDGNHTCTYTLSWKIEKQENDDQTNFETMNGIIKVYVKDGISKDYILNSVDRTNEYKNLDVSGILEDNERGKVRVAYDIYFMKGAFEEKVSGEFTVQILIPENLRDKTIKVIHIDENDELTSLEFTCDGDYVVFNTTHFSVYGIVEVKTVASVPWIIWVVIALLVIFIIGLVVELYIKRKEEPMVISGEEQQAVEEQSVEEQSVEESSVEQPIEQDDLIDEEDEQVSFEDEKPLDIPEPENDSDRFEDSYFGSLINSQEETKGYYAIIKKEILSYSLNGQKVESKISWKNEKFVCGDVVVAKFKMRNNKLYVSFPLTSDEYLGTVGSASQDNFVCCIKNGRRCKYAKSLVAVVMKNYGLTK